MVVNPVESTSLSNFLVSDVNLHPYNEVKLMRFCFSKLGLPVARWCKLDPGLKAPPSFKL